MKKDLFFKKYYLFFLLFLLNFLIPAIYSQADLNNQNSIKDFAYGLEHKISIYPTYLSTSPAKIDVYIKISNPYSQDLTLYLLTKKQEGYIIDQMIGVLPAKTTFSFNLSYNTFYNGSTTIKRNFAIVAKGADVPVGFYFDVIEDWSNYEKNKQLEIFNLAKILIPFSGLIFILLIGLFGIFYFHFSKKQKDIKINLFDFLIGDLKSYSSSDFSFLILNPIFWFLFLGVGFLLFRHFFGFYFEHMQLVFILFSFILSLLIPFIYFIFVW
jgi:hypothetical protein